VGDVCVDMSMSLDGYIAGPNDDVDPLHTWMYGLKAFREPHGEAGGTTDRDSEILDEAMKRSGASIVGRRMYELAEGWGDNPPFHEPVFVLTHEAREPLVKAGGTTFTFVSDGVESAMTQARDAAGGRDISVRGGASTVQQFIAAGLVDEIQIHIVPILLGRGIRLFDEVEWRPLKLEATRVVESPAVTHLRYRVVR
jgi:dihydrofolate reductase